MSTLLKLSRAIYQEHIVQEACRAYQGLADIHVTRSDRYMLVTFDACRYDAETTAREFENYCIGLESKRPEAAD